MSSPSVRTAGYSIGIVLWAAALFGVTGLGCSTGSSGKSEATAATCPQSIASYCGTSGADCDTTWAAAQARWAASLCSGQGNSLQTGCSGFNILLVENLDAPVLEYFNPQSGELVAVIANEAKSGGGEDCIAGPSPFADAE